MIYLERAIEWVNNASVWIKNEGNGYFITKNNKVDYVTKINTVYYKAVKKDTLIDNLDVDCFIENPELNFEYSSLCKDEKKKNDIKQEKNEKVYVHLIGLQ